jgi:TPR repeat protein
VSQNYAEAAKWHRLAANQGLADAQFTLGFMYAHGQGVSQDYAEAVKWYQLAADQGYTLSQANLGNAYVRGQGAPRDFVRAYMWFSLSARKDNQGAAKNCDLIAPRMTPAQIAEAQKLAREWKPTAAPPQ